MGCGDQLYPTLCNCAACQRLCLCSDLIHYDNLWHVILYGLHLAAHDPYQHSQGLQ